ncbi:MAG: NAD(P)/FAD-dependent oxidoreductase [Gammaproteobacteria bacterium]|jgi:dimethylaniline monooxygenase (N-oxide forming)|nr:NAD(P)/FAD-dependent oxidoreductase [Gammaproteobacteria bacterium]
MSTSEDSQSKNTNKLKVDASNQKRVGIIGAGIAGLVTAKVFLSNGFEVVVFDKEPALGGVWAPSRTYPGLRANNSRETYCFSDFAHAKSVGFFPSADNIRDYLESYTDHFQIRQHIRFNREVTQVASKDTNPNSGFEITVRNIETNTSETLHFPFVVICNGAFSKSSIPEIEGMDKFAGHICHSSKSMDPDVADAKKVITVGAGKSALDCAAAAAKEDKSSTIVFRRAHWMAPRFFPGGIRSDLRMVSRFVELFIEYPYRTRFEKLLHGPGKPLVKLWWAVQNAVIPKAAKMAPIMIPDHKMPRGFESIGQIDDFYDLLNADRIKAIRAGIKKFTEKGIELDNGEHIDADLVIFATGWQRDLSFIEESLRNQIFKSARFRLYRRILPPEQQRLAFVGYFPTLACPISSEVAAHWTAQCFSGALSLPSLAGMDTEIERLEDWARERLPESPDGIFTGPYHTHYVSDLMGDMKMQVNRTSNFLTEYLGTFFPKRYASLEKDLQAARNGDFKSTRHFYFSGLHALVGFASLTFVWIILG